jgi:hypothetical protein
MKKRFTYLAILVLFAVLSGFVILKYERDKNKKESELYEIIPRKGNSIQSPEWTLSKKISVQLIQKIINDPSDVKSRIALVAIYLRRPGLPEISVIMTRLL